VNIAIRANSRRYSPNSMAPREGLIKPAGILRISKGIYKTKKQTKTYKMSETGATPFSINLHSPLFRGKFREIENLYNVYVRKHTILYKFMIIQRLNE